jgi:hypothetical protein
MSNRTPTMYNDRAAAQLAADMMSKGIEAHNPFTPHQHARKNENREKISRFASRGGLAELERTLDVEDTNIRNERQDLKMENNELKLKGDRMRRKLKTFSIPVDPNEELRGENARLRDMLAEYKRMLRDAKNKGVRRSEGLQAGRKMDVGAEEGE